VLLTEDGALLEARRSLKGKLPLSGEAQSQGRRAPVGNLVYLEMSPHPYEVAGSWQASGAAVGSE
jgi:hypothetical protein